MPADLWTASFTGLWTHPPPEAVCEAAAFPVLCTDSCKPHPTPPSLLPGPLGVGVAYVGVAGTSWGRCGIRRCVVDAVRFGRDLLGQKVCECEIYECVWCDLQVHVLKERRVIPAGKLL